MTENKFVVGVEYVLCGFCDSEKAGLIWTGQAAAFDPGPCVLCGRSMEEFGGGGYYVLAGELMPGMIQQAVIEIIAEQYGWEENEVLLDTTFEQLGGGAMDITEMVMSLEEEFGIEIPEEDAYETRPNKPPEVEEWRWQGPQWRTVLEVIDYIRGRRPDAT